LNPHSLNDSLDSGNVIETGLLSVIADTSLAILAVLKRVQVGVGGVGGAVFGKRKAARGHQLLDKRKQHTVLWLWDADTRENGSQWRACQRVLHDADAREKMSRNISPDDDRCFDCLTEDDEEDGHSKVVLGHGGRTQDGCRGKWQRRGSSQGLNATGGGRCSTTPRFVLDYGQDGLGQC
jgi:hypothetical protein